MLNDIDRINELVGNKRFEEVKPLILQNLEEEPNNIELLKLLGLTDVNLNQWNDAKKAFETVVKYESQDATSWFYLGNCYENLGDLLSAKNAYLVVIRLRPEYLKAYKNICVLYLKLNDLHHAIEYAQKAKATDGEDYIYDFIIGSAYMKMKEFENAVEFLLNADKKLPENTGILNSLGTCYVALNKTDDAIKLYEHTIEINKTNPMSYYNLASVYQILQQHDKAVELLKKALEIEEDEVFLSALAMSEVKLKKYNEALEHYKQLSLMSPGKEHYKYNIITCYEALNDLSTAIKMLEELVYMNPKFIIPAQKLASLYIKTNQLNKAKDIYEKILLKDRVTPEIFHQYAILSSSLCDTDTAEKMLKKAIKMNPDSAKAHKDLGIIYLNKRLFDYAEDEFKTALELEPNNYDILFEYANYLYSVSKNNEAEEYYIKSLEINPENPLALTFMALNKLILNQLEAAKSYIMKALKIKHEHEYILFCAGRILYSCKEYEEAKNYLIRAVEKNPNIETQNTLALTYFALEDYNQALTIFKNINNKCPKSVSVLMDIARCYEKLNDKDQALEFLDKVVEIIPEYEDAQEMIRKLS